jgi:hypothetical protein
MAISRPEGGLRITGPVPEDQSRQNYTLEGICIQ